MVCLWIQAVQSFLKMLELVEMTPFFCQYGSML